MSTLRDHVSTLMIVEGASPIDSMQIAAQFHTLWMTRNPEMKCYSYTFEHPVATPALAVTKDDLRLLEAKTGVLPTEIIPDWNALLLWIHRRHGTARTTSMVNQRPAQQESRTERKQIPNHYNANESVRTDVLHLYIHQVTAQLTVLATYVRMLDCRVIFMLPSRCLQSDNDCKMLAQSGLPMFSQLVVTTSAEAEERWLRARFHGCNLTRLGYPNMGPTLPRQRRPLVIDTIPRLDCVHTLNQNVRRVHIGSCLPAWMPSDLFPLVVGYEIVPCSCKYCLREF